MKKILPAFSYIFHPVFIPAMATFLYFLFHLGDFNIHEIAFVSIQIIILTLLIPLALYFLLKSTGTVDSIMLANVAQRKIPLILHCFLIILIVRRTITVTNYIELHFFFLGALFSTLIALGLVFAKIKASLHILGISALTVFVFGLNIHLQASNVMLLPFLVLMNGFVASSRLVMNAHTPKELITGFLAGSIPQLLFLYLWL